MKTSSVPFLRRYAFTLIELLVVIAVIAVLAALIFPAAAMVKRKSAEKRVFTQLQAIEKAIEHYHENVKVFPPENPINPALSYITQPERNTLFYELGGVKLIGTEYEPVGGGTRVTEASLKSFLGLAANAEFGLLNVSRGGDDEGHSACNCLGGIRPNQYLEITGGATVLGVTDAGPVTFAAADGRTINPFRYASARATNNVGRFDLWVDVVIAGKTNRFSNWSDKPQLVAY